MKEKIVKAVRKKTKFLTAGVIIVFLSGVIFFMIGEFDLAGQFLVDSWAKPISSLCRAIGIAFMGSGVFSGIIRSSTYMDIFSETLGEIIWSDKYIQSRGDKEQVWSMVSKTLYNQKFPAISGELEKIVKQVYFPMPYNFYLEDYEYTLNITGVPGNDLFLNKDETIKLIIKPINKSEEIEYVLGGDIDLVSDHAVVDITSCTFSQLKVNGKDVDFTVDDTGTTTKKQYHKVTLKLSGHDQYTIEIKKDKVVYRKTNPETRFYARYIVNKLRVTIITNSSIKMGFHKAGTVNEFKKEAEVINGDIKMRTWIYDGIILPHQGFIAVLQEK